MHAHALAAIAAMMMISTSSIADEKVIASYHDKPGRSASGEMFDPQSMMAGHATLAFGSIVEVQGPKGSVSVRIVDRAPPGRIVVSSVAADVIGIRLPGSAPAIIREGSIPTDPPAENAPTAFPGPRPDRPEPKSVANSQQTGLASHYGQGDGFDGRTTANGETHRVDVYTAAHRTLPFGTRVRVTNLDNGKSVIVRINDRGPYVDGRIIDLAPTPFADLASLATGVIRVSIEILKREAMLTIGDETLSGLDPIIKRSDDVNDYLCEVYGRSPTKKDSSGDFTWKDPAAAKRVGLDVCAYSIGGMHPDLRESLFAFGKIADERDVPWTILSAFRDDYRQKIASGYKANGGNSMHGGSRATKGYGDGRAIDLWVSSGPVAPLFKLIDEIGASFGLTRPMKDGDPAHIQLGGGWQKIAATLRHKRTGIASVVASAFEPVRITVRPEIKKRSRKQRRGKDDDDD